MRLASIVGLCMLVSGSSVRADAELDKFQGTWQAEKLSSGGTDAPADKVAQIGITFKGNQAIPKLNPTDVAKVKIDATKKPAEIDLIDGESKVNKGIYRFIDKDTLEICMNVEDAARPKDFVSLKGSTVIIMVMKRVKN